MAKRRREKKVSEGTITAEEFYTAFIDTSLGTHLVMIISSSDTVSDLKKKIVLEHFRLFPRIGEIKILSLQVKRQGHFYHLPDSMLVFSAYEGSKRHKFLYVDASSSQEQGTEQHSSEPDTVGQFPLPQVHDENIHLGSLDPVAFQTDRKGHSEIELNRDHEVLPSERCKPSDEGDADGNNKASILMPKLTVTSGPMEIVTSDGTKRNKKKRAKNKASATRTDSVSEQTNNAGANSPDGPNLNADDYSGEKTDKNESMVPLAETDQTNKVEEERGLSTNLDPQGKTSECFKPADCAEYKMPTKEAVHSSNLLGSNEAMDVGDSTVKKRKKRKTENAASEVQGISEIEHDLNTVSGISLSVQDIAFSNQMSDYDNKSESNVPCVETNQTTAILGDEGLSMERGTKVTSPTGAKPLHLGETNSNISEFAGTPMLSEAKDVKSVSQRKERRTTKSSVINHDGSEMELVSSLNCLSALNDSPASNVADETKNAQGILSQNVWKDASKDESMDASASGAHKEGDKVTNNEAVILPSTEIDRSQEDRGDVCENGRQVLKNGRSSIYNANHDLPVEGETNEAQGLQLNQSGRLKNNVCNVDKKANRKEKKNQIFPAEIPSNSAINEQNIVNAELAASGDKTTGMDSPSSDLPVKGETSEAQGLQLNQSGRLKNNDCNVDKKTKKKKKKNQISAAEILSCSEVSEQNIVAAELAASGDKWKGMGSPSGATMTSGLAKRRTLTQPSNLELENNAGTEYNSSNPEHARKDANPSQVPFKERPETKIGNENKIETAKGEDSRINFRHYFVPAHYQDKVASSVKVKEKSQSIKPKRKNEKHNVIAENKLESSENHGNQNKFDDRNVDKNQVEESASGDEHNKVLLWGNKKTSKASEDGVKASGSHEVEGDKTFERAVKPGVTDGSGASRTAPALLEENNGSLTALSPSSSFKGSKRVVSNTSTRKQQSRFNHSTMSNRKNSGKSAGDVPNSSIQEKNLLTTPRANFREDSSESLSYENKMVNSDASTHTPSDSASSSGYSVGESELSQDTKRNGSVNATRKGGGAGKISHAKFTGPPQMSMDMVLRSSSRFKKAKLAASQSQAADPESQPVDFVPDSRANQ